MTSISLPGLTLGQPWFTDDNGTRWTLTGHTGFRDGPPMRTTFAARTLGAGSYDGPAFPDQRVYTASATARAASPLERDRVYHTLGALLSDGAKAPIVFTDLMGSFQAQVRKSDKPAITLAGNTWVDFSLQFTAPDPRLIDVLIGKRKASTPLAQALGTGGVQYRGPDGTSGVQFRGPDGTSGVIYGVPGAPGTMLLDNSQGTAPADIVFTIKGPCVRPKISTAQYALAYNGNLGPTDQLVISSGLLSSSVRLNGANRRPLLTQADFFLIPKGSTLAVRFTADEQNPTAELSAAYYVTHF